MYEYDADTWWALQHFTRRMDEQRSEQPTVGYNCGAFAEEIESLIYSLGQYCGAEALGLG